MTDTTGKTAAPRFAGQPIRYGFFHLIRAWPPQDERGSPAHCWPLLEPLQIGRQTGTCVEPGNDDPAMSRRHLVVAQKGSVAMVRDLGSSNGTFVNGKQVASAYVLPGNVIRAGNSLFLVLREPPLCRGDGFTCLVGSNAELADTLLLASRAAAEKERTILLLGETGTGKDVLARCLHDSAGTAGPFVHVNCAELADSLFESRLFGAVKGSYTDSVGVTGFAAAATGGTLYLDEIGELPDAAQAKLLVFSESRRFYPVGLETPKIFRGRIVAATNRVDPDRRIPTGLRLDLRQRLSETVLYLPPLRERREDIVPLTAWFLNRDGRSLEDLSASTVELMLTYSWPGNVRELHRVLSRSVLECSAGRRSLADLIATYLTREVETVASDRIPGSGVRAFERS